jgi:CheY-like chemotaxis protein
MSDVVVAVVTDLFFQARVSSTARAAGRHVIYVRDPAQLDLVGRSALGLVDLDAQTDVIGMIRALKGAVHGPVVAFGPHLDTDKRKAARAAGADRVLAKSKFVTELPRLMDYSSPTGQDDLQTLLQELQTYGRRLEELGRLLQDPTMVRRLYLAPEPHMEAAGVAGEPIILDSADYMPYVAVDVLKARLDRLHRQAGETGAAPSA